MRYYEIINELKMSPNRLALFAKTPMAANIRAGFEAELFFSNLPGGSEPDAEGEIELDYDRDEPISTGTDMDDIVRFFGLGYYESKGLQNDYKEYCDEAAEDWKNDKIDKYYERARRENPDLVDLIDGDDESASENAAEELSIIAYDLLHDEYEPPSVGEFLMEMRNVSTMAEVANEYGYTWPHTKEIANEDWVDSANIIASAIQSINGGECKVSTEYHQSTKDNKSWYLEPDGSISGKNAYDFGVEVVSPPMPLDRMIQDLKDIMAEFQHYGVYSNRSTGLHIGMSIAGEGRTKLDYLKLLLFLGDTYVLEQFGRQTNSYTRSSLAKVKADSSTRDSVFGYMRQGLTNYASTLVASTNTDKYVSVNVKDNYIEFRSIGGNYVSQLDLVINTILRYALAFSIACDPNAERKEYAKKLAKLYANIGGDDLALFVNYAAGIKLARIAATQVGSPIDLNTTIADYQKSLKGSLANRQGQVPGQPQLARSPAPNLPKDPPKPNRNNGLIQFPQPTPADLEARRQDTEG